MNTIYCISYYYMYIIYIICISYIICNTRHFGGWVDKLNLGICYASSSPYNPGVVDGNTNAGFETNRLKYPSPA